MIVARKLKISKYNTKSKVSCSRFNISFIALKQKLMNNYARNRKDTEYRENNLTQRFQNFDFVLNKNLKVVSELN